MLIILYACVCVSVCVPQCLYVCVCVSACVNCEALFLNYYAISQVVFHVRLRSDDFNVSECVMVCLSWVCVCFGQGWVGNRMNPYAYSLETDANQLGMPTEAWGLSGGWYNIIKIIVYT